MFWPPPNRPVGLPSQYRINRFYWFCDLKTQKIAPAAPEYFINNNLGIEEAPQLQDESGPRRIDQGPEGRIIGSNVRFGSVRHGFMWSLTRLILPRFGAWPKLGSTRLSPGLWLGWAGN